MWRACPRSATLRGPHGRTDSSREFAWTTDSPTLLPPSGGLLTRPVRAIDVARHYRAPRPLSSRPALLGSAGCQQQRGLSGIDAEIDALIAESSATAQTDPLATPAALMQPESVAGSRDRARDTAKQPATINPAADDLTFVESAEADAESVIRRLDRYAAPVDNARKIDLTAALACAVANSREYRFEEESYVLTALSLLIERHRWGPRFFDEISATASGGTEESLYDSSLRLVNDLSITQRLPYGGEVSARALAVATEDLHRRVSGEGVNSTSLILSANIPLLRGAGLVAQESLIQRERDVIYAARDFERFRREFLFDITRDFLGLVVDLRRIENAEREVASFRQLEERQAALHVAGRATTFDAAEARNDSLESLDNLNSRRESFRLARRSLQGAHRSRHR